MRHSLFFGVFIALISVSNPAFAVAPTVAAVGGASSATLTGAITIFGGLAGDLGGCVANDTRTTCNSCTTTGVASCTRTPLCPCNTSRIYDGLILTIFVNTSTTDANGQTVNNTNPVVLTTTAAPTVPINTNAPASASFVEIPWTTLCNMATTNGGNGCEGLKTAGQSSTTITLNLYNADANGQIPANSTATQISIRILSPDRDAYSTYGSTNTEGIKTFEPYPGDGKIYIKDPETTTNFPILSYASKAVGVRVFMSKTNLPDANPLSTETKDMSLNADGSALAKNAVDGLENNTPYFFRLGLIDEAANIVQLTPDSNASVDAEAASTACVNGTAGCKYSGTPEEVSGLFPNDYNCFVATAAYGSMLEPKLNILRAFRARVLLRHPWGRAFNLWYYEQGPYAARFIGDKPILRAAARGALWPVVGFSWLALHHGLTAACAAVAAGLMVVVALAYAGRRRFGD